MAERGIDRAWIEAAIARPDRTEPDPRPGRTRSYRAIPEFGGRVLRVVHRPAGATRPIIYCFPGKLKNSNLHKLMSIEDAMPTIDATTFRRDFGRYQDEAHREPVKVTSHGRVVGVFLSSHDLEHYERLKRRERQVYVAGEIPDDIVEAIEKAEYLKPAS